MKQLLYEQVMLDIEKKIISGDYPLQTRLPSEKELADYYQVSAITIKRALTELKDLGYLSRKPREGTIVVSEKKVAKEIPIRTNLPLIGAVVTNFTDVFGTHILNGLLEEEDTNTNIILKKSLGDAKKEERLIKELIDLQIDGLILLPSTSQYLSPTILELASNQFPMVVIDRTLDNLPISSITTDNRASANLLTSYLIELGHQHIGILSSSNVVSSANDRLQGYIQAHAALQVTMDDSLNQNIIESVIPDSLVPISQDIEAIIGFIKDHPKMTAIIATEYNIAVLARKACYLLGKKVPEDLSIACFDHPDNHFDDLAFTYTHIKQQQEKMGRACVNVLLEQIDQPENVTKTLISGELVIGDSTAKLN